MSGACGIMAACLRYLETEPSMLIVLSFSCRMPAASVVVAG